MLARDHILAPKIVPIEFAVAPVVNMLESLQLLTEVDDLSGLGSWITETAAVLSADRKHSLRLIFEALYPVVLQSLNRIRPEEDVPHLLNNLAEQDPYQVVEALWDALEGMPAKYPENWPQDASLPTREQLKNNRDVYAEFMTTLTGECNSDDQDEIWSEAFALLQDPPRVVAMVIDTIKAMYEQYFKAEWERVQPMIQEAVSAFQKLDYSNMTAFEALRAITGRDLTGKIELNTEHLDRIIFVPTAHIGPYVGQFKLNRNCYLLFGARPPRGVQAPSSDLSRAELLIRLNALADDTRLRILELLTQHDELYAQDIIEHIGLSQPTISRHLSQLSASGYITERRREVAKVYSLNTDRVMDTLSALTNFLSRQ